VGLIADTHVGEFLAELPQAVFSALDGCDLILHAGDLSVMSVRDDLEQIAPVRAVRGDHDRDADDLPESLVAVVAGQRIGLIHGSLGRVPDAAVVLAQAAAGRPLPWRAGYHRRLIARLGSIDALVYGHWHFPVIARAGAVTVVNPGAVCPEGSLCGGKPPGTGMTGVADRIVRRFRAAMPPADMLPSVAILEVGTSGVRPRLVTLDTSEG
jgi:uncharacterized protein